MSVLESFVSHGNLPRDKGRIRSLDLEAEQEEYKLYVVTCQRVFQFSFVGPLIHDQCKRISLAKRYRFRKGRYFDFMARRVEHHKCEGN